MITIRPDRIARTGVVQPTQGYSPDPNAYAVAQRFAASDQLQGTIGDYWTRFKTWMRTSYAQKQAMLVAQQVAAAQAAQAAAAGSAPAGTASTTMTTSAPMSGAFGRGHFHGHYGLRDTATDAGTNAAPYTNTATNAPSSPGQSLPPSTAAPGYAGQSPDATQMSAMGLYISSGYQPSLIPSVVQGKQQAARRITGAEGITDMPMQLAARAAFAVNGGRAVNAGITAAQHRFYAMNKARDWLMPSIFTLGGVDGPRTKKRKSSGTECHIGECKEVRNSRTGKKIDLCCVGKKKSRSGWLFRSKGKKG